ncbi:hypothetical protein GLW08_08400 [Pontibacillus yanchengensis]|uniref:Uncharacterized protein n=1 Tax=Pontibacillus yanchengensis TaxID=462910 RepID=A0ACC7VEZ2_9BACI|nr:SPOR domain-containing protein [Pontibacillus yanchengensis]MYL53357.1 hypothetical protein [Pontibacillus yanchengensis]
MTKLVFLFFGNMIGLNKPSEKRGESVDNSKKISIRINGEHTYLNRDELDKDEQVHEDIQVAQDEQASAIEDWMEEQEKKKQKHQQNKEKQGQKPSSGMNLSVLERAYPLKRKKLQFPGSWKHLVMAGMSAVFVGIILGFVMLRLFSGLEAQQSPGSEASPASTSVQSNNQTTNNSKPASSGQKQMYSFPTMKAFVVQAGIFSTKNKATTWQSDLSTKGITSYIWERDKQFYLFAGVAPSKEEGEKIATYLKAQGFDTFVKDWSVTGQEVKAAQSEGKWIEKGMNHWSTFLAPVALQIDSGKGDIANIASQITDWKKSIPGEATEKTSILATSMDQLHTSSQRFQSSKSTSSLWEMQRDLLKIWFSYEQFIKKSSS